MKFHLDDEQNALMDSVSRCLASTLDTTKLLGLIDGDTGHDPALWRSLGDLGVFGALVPDADGGVGLGILEAALVSEVMGYHAAPGPWLGQMLATLAIAEGGSDDQRGRWLPRLAAGAAIGTVALAEADERWQPDQWQCAAGSPLHGGKRFVPYPELADVMVVGVEGGLALVESADGWSVPEPLPCLDGTRRVAHIEFDGVDAEPLSTRPERLRDAALVLLAADAFGGARRCVDMAVGYALEREQFGRLIGSFQGLKHQLADMAASVEPARGLYWYAAHAFDAGLDDAPAVAALAKAHVADRFLQAARAATEAHGGIGYTWEYPLHIWLKRAVFDRTWLGTPALHRRRYVELCGWATAT